MLHFVGAGPGDPELITVRGKRMLQEADTIIYAGSLVNHDLLKLAQQGCKIYDSASMTLEEVIAAVCECEEDNGTSVRLHTGDPSLYGAIREQMDELDALGIEWDVTPGVSAFSGAAAALGVEYTLPEVSQTLIITRAEGRTAVPKDEALSKLASHGASMAIYLSVGLAEKVEAQLLEGGYTARTPVAIVYKATWPEEKTIRGTLGQLSALIKEHDITKTALILVGNFLGKDYARSKLYDPGFTHGYRQGKS